MSTPMHTQTPREGLGDLGEEEESRHLTKTVQSVTTKVMKLKRQCHISQEYILHKISSEKSVNKQHPK